jgi:hypothetical protein
MLAGTDGLPLWLDIDCLSLSRHSISLSHCNGSRLGHRYSMELCSWKWLRYRPCRQRSPLFVGCVRLIYWNQGPTLFITLIHSFPLLTTHMGVKLSWLAWRGTLLQKAVEWVLSALKRASTHLPGQHCDFVCFDRHLSINRPIGSTPRCTFIFLGDFYCLTWCWELPKLYLLYSSSLCVWVRLSHLYCAGLYSPIVSICCCVIFSTWGCSRIAVEELPSVFLSRHCC